MRRISSVMRISLLAGALLPARAAFGSGFSPTWSISSAERLSALEWLLAPRTPAPQPAPAAAATVSVVRLPAPPRSASLAIWALAGLGLVQVSRSLNRLSAPREEPVRLDELTAGPQGAANAEPPRRATWRAELFAPAPRPAVTCRELEQPRGPPRWTAV